MVTFSKYKISGFFLFVGFFLVPFTSLRFGLVGPGELCILISFILSLFSGLIIRIDKNLRIFYFFLISFIFISIIGFFIIIFYYTGQVGILIRSILTFYLIVLF